MDQLPGKNSKEVISAVLVREKQSRHLPDEIWCLILAHVRDSTGLESCFGTSKQLNRLLHGSQCTWLFGKALPHIYQHLDSKDVLACRKVCLPWCNDIDSFLSDINEFTPFNKKMNRTRGSVPEFLPSRFDDRFYFPYSQVDMKGWTYSMKNIDTISEFLTKFSLDQLTNQSFMATNGKRRNNPFIGQSIVIYPFRQRRGKIYIRLHPEVLAFVEKIYDDYFWPLDSARYWGLVRKCLTNFGAGIHHLSFSGYSERYPFSYLDCLTNLKECLIRLPNLKTLNLRVEEGGNDSLPDVMSQIKLPRLSSLKTLSLRSTDCNPWLNYLIQQFAETLERLDIRGYSEGPLALESVRKTLRLKELNIYRDDKFVRTGSILEAFSECPLEKLYVPWNYGGTFNYHEETYKLMKQISGFGATLLSLKLMPMADSYCSRGYPPYSCSVNWEQLDTKKCTPFLHQSIQSCLSLSHVRLLQLHGYLDGSIDFILKLTALVDFIWEPQFPNEPCGHKLDK